MIIKRIRNIILFLLLVCAGLDAQAQGSYYNRLAKRHIKYVSFGLSTASYFGDLHRRVFVPHGGIHVQFNQYIGSRINWRVDLNLYAIRGDDNTGKHNLEFRNLSFQAYNAEISTGVEISFAPVFYSKKRPLVNPYVFASVGLSSNNPQVNYDGKVYNLRKLQTEG